MSEEEDAKPADPARALLEAIRRAARPIGPEELAAATGISEASVRRTLGRLAGSREIARAGGGKFTIAKHRRSG